MKNYSEFNFEEETKINLYQLDIEVAQHGQKFMEWVKIYARAEKEAKQAEYEYKETEAKIDLTVRTKSPKDYGLDKFSETAIGNIVRKSKKLQIALQKKLEANENLRIIEEMKNDMGFMSKAMIEKAVELSLSGYNSEPNLNKEGRKKLQKETQERLKQNIKRRLVNEKEQEEI